MGIKAIDRTAIAIPSGRNHQTKWFWPVGGPLEFESIVPHEIMFGSPNPRNVSAASVRIAEGTVSAMLA